MMIGAGCYRMTIRTGAKSDRLNGEQTGVSIFYGASPMTTEAPECRDGISEASVYWPWWSPIVSVLTQTLTFGLLPITAVTAEYTCAQAAPADGASTSSVPSEAPST
jgi:hypothetical protein